MTVHNSYRRGAKHGSKAEREKVIEYLMAKRDEYEALTQSTSITTSDRVVFIANMIAVDRVLVDIMHGRHR